MSQSLSLQGRVMGPAGNPQSEVAVSIREAPVSVPDLSVLTDGSGRFVLHGLATGTYVLYFMPPEGDGFERRVTLSTNGQLFEFFP